MPDLVGCGGRWGLREPIGRATGERIGLGRARAWSRRAGAERPLARFTQPASQPVAPDDDRLRLRLVGRLLLGRRTELLPGTNEVALGEAGELATGVYLLKVTQGKQRTMLKLVRE